MTDDPLHFAMVTAMQSNSPVGKLVNEFIVTRVPDWNTLMVNLHDKINRTQSSRYNTYKDFNPLLQVHEIYKHRHTIKEHHRRAFTQFRVSGHNLCIETGRWNRRGRGRLPPEDRLCECGLVQTERHVAQHCPLSQGVRDSYQFTTLEEVFSEKYTSSVQCKIIFDLLEIYK